ncbi:hypothetical protein GBA52_015479 [Prunus armeniaca]|nr:hypothetical protein GBA52_015479 [Prunus armeniaca]
MSRYPMFRPRNKQPEKTIPCKRDGTPDRAYDSSVSSLMPYPFSFRSTALRWLSFFRERQTWT